MNETNWIDCLAEGTWQAMNGNWVSFSKEDLDAIVKNYDPAVREAPLVFGHPAVDDPAFGWPSRMQVVLDEKKNRYVLQTKFKQIPRAVKDLVDQGHFAKISMSFMPDKVTVRHFGLLGAAQPAVDGLRRVSFSAGEESIDIEFASKADPDPHKGRNNMKTVEQLETELAAEKEKSKGLQDGNDKLKTELSAVTTRATTAEATLAGERTENRNRAIDARLDKLVAAGRLLPADRATKKMVALSLADDATEIELSAGSGKKTKLEIFFEDLEKAPQIDLLGHEFSAPEGDREKGAKLPADLTMRV